METLIFLTEARSPMGEKAVAEILGHKIAPALNTSLPRLACKMATGTGKTAVMAMVIAWLTLNRQCSAKKAAFADGFLVVAPNVTIRDRLRVAGRREPVAGGGEPRRQRGRRLDEWPAAGEAPSADPKKLARQQKAVTEAHKRYPAGMREATILRLAERRMAWKRANVKVAAGHDSQENMPMSAATGDTTGKRESRHSVGERCFVCRAEDDLAAAYFGAMGRAAS